ncbi:transcriptional regulator [Emticicia sp. C21]|uniref:winged helix-turn-helix domain-containing protein n=1 Tax=Emticicia sp. C21 TaxID=2302915 RepID=UPI000E34AADD|nr:transcriptional regulator [Emticicia sp. C21]RFS14265.1 transcriptional regulator [Emticicia sp. C21]
MFNDLDPLIHSQLRLAIMSILVGVEQAEFVYLKEKTNATSGNLSVQLEKLQQANYISIEKTFKGKYPLTICRITTQGGEAFSRYVKDLQAYLRNT